MLSKHDQMRLLLHLQTLNYGPGKFLPSKGRNYSAKLGKTKMVLGTEQNRTYLVDFVYTIMGFCHTPNKICGQQRIHLNISILKLFTYG